MDLRALTTLEGVVMRLVEPQGAQATRRLTDSLQEQALLEDFLDASKPELPDPRECPRRHRLLLTPFRCRKRHGSRFSSRLERGLFYGSRSRGACLLEGAYYELVFQNGPVDPFPRAAELRKTLFHVQVATRRGLQLQHQQAPGLQQALRDPSDYRYTQAAGAQMRGTAIEAFEYHSARSSEEVVNLGAFTCAVFQTTPFDQVEVQMEASRGEVAIRCSDDNTVWQFSRAQFEVDAVLPAPAL